MRVVSMEREGLGRCEPMVLGLRQCVKQALRTIWYSKHVRTGYGVRVYAGLSVGELVC